MLLYWIVLVLAWIVFHLVFRIEVIGRENLQAVQDGRPLVVAPNHISALDPVFVAIIVMQWKRMNIPAKAELFQNPLGGWFLRCMGAVPVVRGKGDTSMLEKVTTDCQKGHGVLIFPEGTRTKNGELGVLKSGAFVIAEAAHADLLPCRIIYGTKDGRLHLFCKVRVCFGEAIPAQQLQITDTRHKVAALRSMKADLRERLKLLLAENRFSPKEETGQ